MALVETLALLLSSLVVLFLASREVITHALVLAKILRLSHLAVGFLLVAVATSLPELAVGVMAALNGVPTLGLGNVLGSNIGDITAVLGLTALVAGRMTFARRQTSSLVKILFVTSLLPLLFLVFPLSPAFGGVLLLGFVAFAYYTLHEHVAPDLGNHAPTIREAVTSALLFALSVAVILFSSNYVVRSALELSALLGLSAAVVGATIVAFGTYLPELTISVAAAIKRRYSLAVGNLLGSAVINLTLVLGLSTVLSRNGPVNAIEFLPLIVFAVIANLFLWYFVHENKQLTRREGAALVLVYLVFLFSTLRTGLA